MKNSIVFVAIVILSTLNVAAGPWFSNTQTLAADDDHQYDPVIAYNSVHDEYLVVWYVDVSSVATIFGVRVDAQGYPIGSSFTISDPGNAQWDPAVSYDPVNDHYLVVWTFDYSGDGSDTDILGRFIPWNGPSPSDPVFVVDDALSMQGFPALAYNPQDLEFLVVWQDNAETGPYQIFGRRIFADGSTALPPWTIVPGPVDAFEPKVACNGETGDYLIVYSQPGAGGETDVYGALIGPSGGSIQSDIGIAGWPGGEWSPDVAGCRGDFMVVWIGALATESDPDTEIYARSVSGTGVVGTIVTDLPGDFTYEGAPSVTCNRNGAEVLVAWDAAFPGINNFGVVGSLLELSAAPKGGVFSIYAPSAGNQLDYRFPGVAFGRGDHALVAWESDRPPDGLIEDIRGRFVGDRLFADGFESGDQIYWFDQDS